MVPEEKLIYTIGDAARLIDVKPYVLRYWETEFHRLNPEKSVTGQRCYRAKDLRTALTIKRLLHAEKFTIAGAKQKLEELGEDGLDQLNIFGAAAPNPGPSESLVPEPVVQANAPAAKENPVGRPAMIQSGEDESLATRADLGALRRLIAESLELLRKYP